MLEHVFPTLLRKHIANAVGNRMEKRTRSATGKGRQPQQRNWVFTLNNYTNAEVDSIAESIEYPFGRHVDNIQNAITFVGVAEEIGKTGTPHLQGYLQLRRKGIV